MYFIRLLSNHRQVFNTSVLCCSNEYEKIVIHRRWTQHLEIYTVISKLSPHFRRLSHCGRKHAILVIRLMFGACRAPSLRSKWFTKLTRLILRRFVAASRKMDIFENKTTRNGGHDFILATGTCAEFRSIWKQRALIAAPKPTWNCLYGYIHFKCISADKFIIITLPLRYDFSRNSHEFWATCVFFLVVAWFN